MADVVDKATRSRMMAGIKGKDTNPEIFLRKALFALGFRFRLHRPDIPGRPDIVLPKHRALVLVHGCYWHGHQCRNFKWPVTNAQFWRDKIDAIAGVTGKTCQHSGKPDGASLSFGSARSAAV